MCQTINSFAEPFVTMDEFLETMLKEHEETYDPSEVRDFVDIYIKTRLESEDAHLYNGKRQRIEYFRLLLFRPCRGVCVCVCVGGWVGGWVGVGVCVCVYV